MKVPSAPLATLAVVMLAGCAWRIDPQYSTVEYSVNGNAANLTITAVTDEWGAQQSFAVASLPWSLDYENDELVPHPPVYLRIEFAPGTAPLTSGNADSVSAGHLVDSSASFVAAGVLPGDAALNAGTGAVSLVTAVTATDLTLTAGDNPFPLGTEAYEVYRMITVTASAFGDGRLIAQTVLGGWGASPVTATVVSENTTAP